MKEQSQQNLVHLKLNPNSAEPWIFQEIFMDKVYNMDYNKDDIILNIWWHIGLYDLMYANQVKEIHTYEPSLENFKRLEEHLKLNHIDNVFYFNKWVGSHQQSATLYHNSEDNTWMNTIIKWPDVRSEKIELLDVNDILAVRSFTKIKCDCEWAEYLIFMDTTIPKTVKEMAFELHTRDDDTKKQWIQLVAAFKEQWFEWAITKFDWDTAFNIVFKR